MLISNAGILTPGPLEVLPLDAVRFEFEVNVFGALAVVNSFLPALRKARGRIVQVSTMTATLPFPFNGLSGASKAAFDALAAVYRAELKPFGIDVVLAVAGNMRTGGPAKTAAALKRVAEQMTSEQRELYRKALSIPLRQPSITCRAAVSIQSRPPVGLSSLLSKYPRRAGEQWVRTPKRFSG
jgi:NAD(P)-dependent dehydrogenase (short-subunit alcohol dehydrogenase family)